jgi:succinoglycan biosynthesis transport protein ExoP
MPAGQTTGQATSDANLSDAWLTIRKHKYLIIGIALLGTFWGYRKDAQQPRLYTASGTIEIRSGSANQYRITGTSSNEASSSMLTQISILKSDTLLLTVARDLNLANNSYFMGGGGAPMPYRNIEDPAIRQGVIGSMQSVVSVSVVPKTDILSISCSTLNPKLSADIVNKLVLEYIARSFQSRADATKRVSDFFSHQLDDLRQEVLSSQEQMMDLQKRLGVVGLDPSLNQVENSLQGLSSAVNQAELLRLQAEARYSIVAGVDPNTAKESPDAIRISGSTDTLRTQLEGQRAQLATLTSTGNLGPNHPTVLNLKKTIAETEKQLIEEQNHVAVTTHGVLSGAKATENQTRSALNAAAGSADKRRDDLIEFAARQREFASNNALYEGLRERLRTAGVQAGLESTEIDIIDVAVPPISASLQPRSTILITNTSVAFVLGLILAFIIESLDNSLKSVAEIEAISGVPSLALIPRIRRPANDISALTPVMRNLQVLSNPKSQFAESFRALRTSLLLSVAGGEPQVILLTSAIPSEGKTTVSINLACVLAQRDVRVLLIDADLRRPTVHHRFGLNGKIGLTSVLTGAATLEKTVQTVPEMPNLDVLVSGPVPPFPTEMLSSVTMKELLLKCRGIYTHIVMDSPPLLSVTDSVVLARDSDAVVLIIRSGKSSKHALRRARDLLVRSGAPITGIALNAVDLNSPEYYSYYGYYGYTGYASSGVDGAGWESKTRDKSQSDDGGKL